MSGHSKWAKIKRDKAANDAKKGAVFTKMGNLIAVAARNGTNPETNAALALAIDTAKSYNMPQSTINRAIQRVADKSAVNLEEVIYEGYGPEGLAILVECATDNRRRTYPEVKTVFSKNGGNIAEMGSVIFNFTHCGEILLKDSSDEITLQALDAGAKDVLEAEGCLSVITAPADLHQVLSKLKNLSLPIEHAALIYRPKLIQKLSDKDLLRAEKLIDSLEALDDVINVYTNLSNE